VRIATFAVPEMHCSACEQAVRAALSSLAGVAAVDADASAHRVCVQHDDSTTPAQIRERIEAAGFDAEPAAIGSEASL